MRFTGDGENGTFEADGEVFEAEVQWRGWSWKNWLVAVFGLITLWIVCCGGLVWGLFG